MATGAEPCTGRMQDACGCPLPISSFLAAGVKAELERTRTAAAAACAQTCAVVRCRESVDAVCETEGGSAHGRCAIDP
jgi:hypothetical protein